MNREQTNAALEAAEPIDQAEQDERYYAAQLEMAEQQSRWRVVVFGTRAEAERYADEYAIRSYPLRRVVGGWKLTYLA